MRQQLRREVRRWSTLDGMAIRTCSVRVLRRVDEDVAALDGLSQLADLLDPARDRRPHDLSPFIALLQLKPDAERRERGDVVAIEQVSCA